MARFAAHGPLRSRSSRRRSRTRSRTHLAGILRSPRKMSFYGCSMKQIARRDSPKSGNESGTLGHFRPLVPSNPVRPIHPEAWWRQSNQFLTLPKQPTHTPVERHTEVRRLLPPRSPVQWVPYIRSKGHSSPCVARRARSHRSAARIRHSVLDHHPGISHYKREDNPLRHIRRS